MEPTIEKQAYEDAKTNLDTATEKTLDTLVKKLNSAATAYNNAIHRENYLATHRIKIDSILDDSLFKLFNANEEIKELIRNHFVGKTLQYILRGDTTQPTSSANHGWQIGIGRTAATTTGPRY